MLCVSSAEFDIVIAVSIKQIFCFFQHPFGVIGRGHFQAERGQEKRKESRAAPDIQHFRDLGYLSEILLVELILMLLSFLFDLLSIAFGASVPILSYLF